MKALSQFHIYFTTVTTVDTFLIAASLTIGNCKNYKKQLNILINMEDSYDYK
ncbi:hypothetical protein TUM4261_13710 [Shewanella sp. c952]|nr:hypothetical protein TUM4261_13710 [Shewanella sp. c952]